MAENLERVEDRADRVRAGRRRLPHRGRQPPDPGRGQAGPARPDHGRRPVRGRPNWATPPRSRCSAACRVELVHLGSLYHDDVMDDATTRRTVESVNARWGNLKAILAGDFLLARASEIAAGLGTEVAGLLAATIARLCEGQVRGAAGRLQRRPHRGRLPHLDRGQDGGPVRLVVPHRRDRGRASTGTASRRLTRSAGPTAWPSRSSTTCSTWSPAPSSWASPPATTWSRASTRCPPCGPCRARPVAELADLLGHPWSPPRSTRPSASSGATAPCRASLVDARAYVDEGRAALDDLGSSPVMDAMAEASDVLVAQIQEYDV